MWAGKNNEWKPQITEIIMQTLNAEIKHEHRWYYFHSIHMDDDISTSATA